jgi:hypothetical protein
MYKLDANTWQRKTSTVSIAIAASAVAMPDNITGLLCGGDYSPTLSANCYTYASKTDVFAIYKYKMNEGRTAFGMCVYKGVETFCTFVIQIFVSFCHFD